MGFRLPIAEKTAGFLSPFLNRGHRQDVYGVTAKQLVRLKFEAGYQIGVDQQTAGQIAAKFGNKAQQTLDLEVSGLFYGAGQLGERSSKGCERFTGGGGIIKQRDHIEITLLGTEITARQRPDGENRAQAFEWTRDQTLA